MFEQFITMKETMRSQHRGLDAFDTVIRNLPELKSKLDDAKKFVGGLIDRGKREINKKRETPRNSVPKIPPPRTQSSVIVARELFADDAPSETRNSPEMRRPARPPPPRPASVAVPERSLNLVDNFR